MTKITNDMLVERLELLNKELQQLSDMQKIYNGAIQDCKFWMEKLNEKAKE